jgi:ABC-type multidrug transport system fused ATPase/permease subunit
MKMIKLMKGLKKYLILMLIFSILQVICELYLPTIMSNVVDKGIPLKDNSFIINETIKMVIVAIIALVSNILVVYGTSKFSNKYGLY